MSEILVIDDSKLNRMILQKRFAETPHTIRVADSGEAGLREMANSLPDLIILDEMMPGISGLDVLQEVRTRYSLNELPIIMFTARDEPAELVKALHMGANDFVIKGADFEEILARVNTHLKLHTLSKLQDEFLRIASHDLKNPISVMMGHLKLLQAANASLDEAEQQAMLSAALKRAESMMAIVEQFLDRSRNEEEAPLILEHLDLALLIREVLDAQRDYAVQKDITLTSSLEQSAYAKADRELLLQALHNVIGNAIKYGPKGSDVVCRMEKNEDSWQIRICDEGSGIPQAKLDKVFDKFCDIGNKPTGDEKSTGLGLYIARNVLLRQGGHIAVHNLQEGGCCFTVTLPVDTGS